MQKDKKKALFLSPSLEHMLFPVPPKLNLQAILLVMPSLSFELNYTLAKHKQIMKKAFSNELQALWWIAKSQNEKVEPRVVAILLFLQLVNSRHDITGFNESFKVQQNSYSPMSSPRTRSNRTLFVSQQIQIFQFIKENLRIFLKLISSDPTSDMINITQAEFNHLSILFRFSGSSFAQSSGLFGPAPRLPLGNLIEHLSMKMASSQSQLHHISNLSQCITVKKEDCSGQDIRIVSCVQSYIYLDAAVGSVHILNCENCTVLVAASARIVYVDKCVNMKITVACPILRVCNSIDSVFNCYTICPPIFTGDNRALVVGPYNAPLKNLQIFFKETGMNFSGKSPGMDTPLCMPADVQMYNLMQPQDFQALVLPEDNQNDIERLVLIPPIFKKQLKERQLLMQELTKSILESGMNLSQMKVLNAHIQGHFREWLRSSGQIKPISDLIKPIN